MTTERLIWRPNEVPLERWEAMSREQQVQWWKDRKQPPRPKPHMVRAIELYNQGEITQNEFGFSVCKLAIREEVEEFVHQCPPALMSQLKRMLASYGEDESRWPRSFSICCYAPWVTDEEIMQSQKREQEQIWNGVRLLKEFIR